MRDPERITRLLTLLEVAWKRHPDFRLAQLVCIAAEAAAPWYVEDGDVEEGLQMVIDMEAGAWEPSG